MYKNKEPIIIYPGCVTFTHKSFFSYVDFIRKSFNKDKIKVFIFTWDEEFNNDYATKLKELVESTSYIDPVFIHEKYNSSKFLNFLNSIKEGQLLHTPFIKKFLIFYSIGRLIEEIGNYNKDSIIFKVRSGYNFKVKNFHGSLLDDFQFNFNDLKFYLDRETFNSANSEDIFWCNRMNASGVSEVVWNTSYSTASKLFGPNIQVLASNFKTILNKYIDKHPDASIEELFEKDYFPHSGPHMVKELADLTIDSFIASVHPFYLYFCFSIGPINPLLYFIKNDDGYETRIINKRSVPYENRKDLILEPTKTDIRSKRFL